jgi:hypothetical protein
MGGLRSSIEGERINSKLACDDGVLTIVELGGDVSSVELLALRLEKSWSRVLPLEFVSNRRLSAPVPVLNRLADFLSESALDLRVTNENRRRSIMATFSGNFSSSCFISSEKFLKNAKDKFKAHNYYPKLDYRAMDVVPQRLVHHESANIDE